MRKAVTIKAILDDGDDVLVVRGTVDGVTIDVPDPDHEGETVKEPLEFEARGWLSALTNHYDASAYDADGNLKDDAKPRQMTTAERRAYCEGLLVAAVEAAPRRLPA